MEGVIPLKKIEKKQRHYDKEIYALRPLVGVLRDGEILV
jgi:hypothetical protein